MPKIASIFSLIPVEKACIFAITMRLAHESADSVLFRFPRDVRTVAGHDSVPFFVSSAEASVLSRA